MDNGSWYSNRDNYSDQDHQQDHHRWGNVDEPTELRSYLESEVVTTISLIVQLICSFIAHCIPHTRVAGVCWLLATAAESLRAFVERVCKFLQQKHCFFYN